MARNENSETKLLEISREVNKLTQMINSLSKAPNSDGQVTKSLMRSVFALQESLITARNLQEASKGKVDFGLMDSARFERISVDGSLFHYIYELKKVIKESNFSQHPGIVSNVDKKVSSSRSLGFLMSTDQPKKSKGLNLIAKLMGLEELPSESSNPTKKEKTDNECLVKPRSTSPIEMSKSRKLLSMEKNTEAMTNSMKDIVEIVKSDELFKGNKIKDQRRMSCSGKKFDNEVPINVVIRSPKLPPRSDKVLVSKKTRAINLIPQEIVCDNGEMLTRKFERKEVKDVKRNKVVSYPQTETSASRKKGDAGPKPLVNGSKPGNKELKTTAAPKSEVSHISRTPATSNNRKRIKYVSSNDQIIVSRGGNASKKNNQTTTAKPTSQVFSDIAKIKKTREANPVKRSMDNKVFTDNAKCKDIKGTDKSCNLPPARKVEENSTYNRGYKNKDTKLFNEVLVKSSKFNRASKASEESIHNKAIVQTAAKVEEANLQLLLLSTQSFIRHAQKLFGFDDYQTTNQQTKGILKLKSSDAKLLVDCAKELMVRKSRQQEISNHQILQTSSRRFSAVSLGRLVNEISNGIKELSDCRKNDAGVRFKDDVFVRLERDLKCKDMMINANWDLGWLNVICVEEADQVAVDIVDIILYGLVEELVVEFFG